jgi:hypothetical protein
MIMIMIRGQEYGGSDRGAPVRDGGHYALPALPGGPWHPERGCGGSHNEWVRMETVGPMLA